MKFKGSSSDMDFLNFLTKEAYKRQKHAKIGDLLLTFKLLNTDRLSSESKLTYAYLFFHRRDVSGCKIRVLSDKLGITPRRIHNSLKALECKDHIHIRSITTQQSDDLSELTYKYDIVKPRRYGMLDLEKEQLKQKEEMALSIMAK